MIPSAFSSKPSSTIVSPIFYIKPTSVSIPSSGHVKDKFERYTGYDFDNQQFFEGHQFSLIAYNILTNEIVTPYNSMKVGIYRSSKSGLEIGVTEISVTYTGGYLYYHEDGSDLYKCGKYKAK